MKLFKSFFIFLTIIFMSVSVHSIAKEEIKQTDYSSESETIKDSKVKSGSEIKKKFEYNKTYGPSPILSFGAGASASPAGYSLITRLDIPWKNDLYIGPVGQFAKGDGETLAGITGNIKKHLPSTDPKMIPSIEAGIGFLVDDEDNDNDDNSSSFLTVAGAGFDYVMSDNLSLGAHGYMNNSFDMDHKEIFFTFLVSLNIRLY
tara:strand:- start:3436 stop:4044 length:609 start_codon:yes stop_codon:yes gene_type:complete